MATQTVRSLVVVRTAKRSPGCISPTGKESPKCAADSTAPPYPGRGTGKTPASAALQLGSLAGNGPGVATQVILRGPPLLGVVDPQDRRRVHGAGSEPAQLGLDEGPAVAGDP